MSSSLSLSEIHGLLGESFGRLFLSDPGLIKKVMEIAGRLEALSEYHPKQALYVAADIVRCLHRRNKNEQE